jgi:hypothetical protein
LKSSMQAASYVCGLLGYGRTPGFPSGFHPETFGSFTVSTYGLTFQSKAGLCICKNYCLVKHGMCSYHCISVVDTDARYLCNAVKSRPGVASDAVLMWNFSSANHVWMRKRGWCLLRVQHDSLLLHRGSSHRSFITTASCSTP